MPQTFRNPILSGFYPDPSICRVGDDYYLVNSSFEYFPGLPIFHSRDLVHWRQIGHVLDRPEQLNLDGVRPSGGLYAPTIRYHAGTFYVTNTLVDGPGPKGNFIVTATDPAGPWSEPVWLDDAPGIDPSLFFDEDGRVWYVGNRHAFEGHYPGHCEIWLQELDLENMTLVGERYLLWDGALKGAVYAEGPHLYRVNDHYYLMIAEGGTGHDHAVTIARSDSITGPYYPNPRNPILTHRHLGQDYPIVGTGHADLVETQYGEWWMVALAMRPYDGYFYNLGRETFLIPV
ncbi:MAG TPA: glycoside hydrolase family 43 protein, partial [Chloroflexi bacterium]|nr:glycoside hydrolase family 43 protein [Chloroflexota bacterium]